ncbi:MAG TPA: NAD-binding protein [Myxococcales bacterium]|nr:NAD-binding protein [Myxococcales bacterium]
MERPIPQVSALAARLRISFLFMSLVGIFGTLGFWLLWRGRGGTLLDAAYMTFLTLTTIGFEEVRPLGTLGRLWTMAVGLSGIGTLFYFLSALAESFVSPEARAHRTRRRMQKHIDELDGHVIVAGLGRVGREAVRELAPTFAVAVIDPTEDARALAEREGWPFILGDAADDEVLLAAGVARARGLVVTTDSDATNTYVVLSAKLLNPKIQVVSRSLDAAGTAKLLRAGATHAISPHAIGGRRLAHLLVNPGAVRFFDSVLASGDQRLAIEDVVVEPRGPLSGKDVGAVPASGAQLLALIRGDEPLVSPPRETKLQDGDHLLVLGTAAQLQELGARLRG